VLLVLVESVYHILATIPQQVTETLKSPQAETLPSTAEEVEVTLSRKEEVSRNFNPNRPYDFLPGDKCIRAQDGAELGLFRGGIAKLKASSLAQFFLCKYRDVAVLMSRRFRLFSDFGEIEFFHRDGGKVGMELRGGAEFSGTHPSKEKWSVKVTMGHSETNPKDRLYIEVGNDAGAKQVTIAFKNSGELDIWSRRTINLKANRINMH
jgi:hypothetical protein